MKESNPLLPDAFLSARQAAAFCQVNFKTVLKWVRQGRLRAYQLPGSGVNRIRVADFLAFLNHEGLPVPPALGPSGVRRVLLVDDDPVFIRLVRGMLRAGEFVVETAADGFEAGRRIVGFRPDTIILDIEMPGMGGREVLSRLREDSGTGRPRVVVVSGGLSPAAARALLKAGADAVLGKPVERDELLRAVGVLSGKGRGRG